MGVPDDCSEVAHCVNTVGSHMCQCKYGYEGDGYNCSGTTLQSIICEVLRSEGTVVRNNRFDCAYNNY